MKRGPAAGLFRQTVSCGSVSVLLMAFASLPAVQRRLTGWWDRMEMRLVTFMVMASHWTAEY
ncbi:hypothetical protein ACFFX0_23200 [Citricoccus parietis]|uniref:Uncharacterized protein n=1 Tax=Citricoccus parietis TaxID=592307 RepID=A0ABV5G4V8_9MICC